MDKSRHAGKVALVTGAGSGIGHATAVRLAEEGATVIATDIKEDGLRGLVTHAPAGMETVAADLTVREDLDRLLEQVRQVGRVSILVNNAGIMDRFLPAHEVDDATWDQVLAINLTVPMALSRALLPAMMEQGAGAIVNVSSVAGVRGGASGAAYAASKHGVIGLTRSIAWTYRNSGIRCNAVCPGGVATAIGATATPQSQWAFEQYQPALQMSGRVAEPDEIAALISWLASEEASNVNGAVVAADNGWTAG